MDVGSIIIPLPSYFKSIDNKKDNMHEGLGPPPSSDQLLYPTELVKCTEPAK